MMVSVTRGSETEVLHFPSIRATYRYLRSCGCRISNSALVKLDTYDGITISTLDCTYDIEKEDVRYGYEKKKREG